MRRSTMKYLEDELYTYKDINKHIKNVRDEILNPWQPQDENIGGGRSNNNVSVTERSATRLVNDRRLIQLERMATAIEKVYMDCDETRRTFLDEYYFKRHRKYTIEGMTDVLHVSRRTVFNIRKEILEQLADELGIMH